MKYCPRIGELSAEAARPREQYGPGPSPTIPFPPPFHHPLTTSSKPPSYGRGLASGLCGRWKSLHPDSGFDSDYNGLIDRSPARLGDCSKVVVAFESKNSGNFPMISRAFIIAGKIRIESKSTGSCLRVAVCSTLIVRTFAIESTSRIKSRMSVCITCAVYRNKFEFKINMRFMRIEQKYI